MSKRKHHRRRRRSHRSHSVSYYRPMGASTYGTSEAGVDTILPDNKIMTLAIGVVVGYLVFGEKKP